MGSGVGSGVTIGAGEAVGERGSPTPGFSEQAHKESNSAPPRRREAMVRHFI